MFDRAEAEYAELSSKKRIVETDRAKIEQARAAPARLPGPASLLLAELAELGSARSPDAPVAR